MLSTVLAVACLSITFTNAVSDSAINYCGSRMCGNTDAHTFCQYPEGPSHECIGYISANLSDEEKARVIARLNRRRNEAAAGRLRGLPSAGNMLKLRWVEELAREAQRWADQCRPPETPEERDSCRDLYSVSVGQCVASVIGEAPGLRVESMVDIWYMQNILYKGNATNYVLPSPNSSFYGDFGQMMWAQSYMVGCGRSRFMIQWRGRLRSVERLVCNIAPRGPPPGSHVWTHSAPTTLCPARSSQDATFEALCDIQIDPSEIHEVDPSMTLEEHFLLCTILDIERNKSLRFPGSLDQLFLTRLAIATMDTIITTEEYNSMQKRDVVDRIGVEATNTYNIPHEQDGVIVLKISTSPTIIPIPIASVKKKMSLIGRPKPYNMEELTDMELVTENYSPSEEITMKEKEFYAEYEFVEMTEENTTVTNREDNVTIQNTTETITPMRYYGVYDRIDVFNYPKANINPQRYITDNYTSQEIMTEISTEAIRQAVGQTTEIYEGLTKHINLEAENVNSLYNNAEIQANDTQIAGSVTNESLLPDKTLNYLSDQETVLELQEALEVMERDMSKEHVMDTPGKVRRELREERDEKQSKEYSRKSPDKGAMYNMVLQYMPYLRDYQNGLSSKAAGRVVNHHSSLLLVILFYACI